MPTRKPCKVEITIGTDNWDLALTYLKEITADLEARIATAADHPVQMNAIAGSASGGYQAWASDEDATDPEKKAS